MLGKNLLVMKIKAISNIPIRPLPFKDGWIVSNWKYESTVLYTAGDG
jgi:hypothetical protein